MLLMFNEDLILNEGLGTMSAKSYGKMYLRVLKISENKKREKELINNINFVEEQIAVINKLKQNEEENEKRIKTCLEQMIGIAAILIDYSKACYLYEQLKDEKIKIKYRDGYEVCKKYVSRCDSASKKALVLYKKCMSEDEKMNPNNILNRLKEGENKFKQAIYEMNK